MSRPGAPSEDDVGLEIGSTLLGKYRIEAILGRGGMGVVARATHLHLGEQVAIKFLRRDAATDPEAAQRFLREAQAAVKLKSEHIARVIDVGTLDGQVPYLVMEYLQGSDLDQMLEQSGTVSPELSVDFILQACEALAEAHALGIVHRDIKPSNVFVTWRHDGTVLVKVLDFGISKVQTALTEMSLTQTQSVLGTPAYMSPEQMRSARTVDARTDIWSLGTVLYELVQGHRPFEAESFSEMCVKVAVDPPTAMTMPMPPGMSDVIMRCLAKDPAARFANVGELADALVPYARDPRAAQLLAEQVKRNVGRGPVPRALTDAGSAPVVLPRPLHHTTERTPPPPEAYGKRPAPTPPPRAAREAYPPKKTTPWAAGGAMPPGMVVGGSAATAPPQPGAPVHVAHAPRAEGTDPGMAQGSETALTPVRAAAAAPTQDGWSSGDSWNLPPTGTSHPPIRISASMGAVGRRLWLSAIVAVLTVGVVLLAIKLGGARNEKRPAAPAPAPAVVVDAAVVEPVAAPVDAGTEMMAVDAAPPAIDAALEVVEPAPAGAGAGTSKRSPDKRGDRRGDKRGDRRGDKRGSGSGSSKDPDDIFGNRK